LQLALNFEGHRRQARRPARSAISFRSSLQCETGQPSTPAR